MAQQEHDWPALLGAAAAERPKPVKAHTFLKHWASFSQPGLRAAKHFVAERFKIDKGNLLEKRKLDKFIDGLGNEIRMTPLRAVRVLNATEELDRLYSKLVGGRIQQLPLPSHTLDLIFQNGQVLPLLQTHISVLLSRFQKAIRIPYGFRPSKGRYNLIQPAVFQGRTPDQIFKKTGELALESELLYEEPHSDYGEMELLVVGTFGPQQKEVVQAVDRELSRNHARLFTLDKSDDLVRLIRETAMSTQ